MTFKPTYHLPPTLSIPPPPSGHIHLGTILKDFSTIEKSRPLNYDDDRVPIAPPQIQQDTKKGFTATRHDLKKGGFGLWAKLLGLDGIGGEASFGAGKSEDDTYEIDELVTTSFFPRPAYIGKSLKCADVEDYLVAHNYKKPVYLVTGLKIAKGVKVDFKNGRDSKVMGKIGAHVPAAGVAVGPNADLQTESSVSFGFKESSDIVFGIQCLVITHKKGLFGSVNRPVDELFTKGATLVDLDDDDEKDEQVLKDFLCEELKAFDGHTLAENDSGDSFWIISK